MGWDERSWSTQRAVDAQALAMLQQLFPISTCFDLGAPFCCCALCFADLPEGCRDISTQVELARGCGHLHSGTKHYNPNHFHLKLPQTSLQGTGTGTALFITHYFKGRELGGICVVLALTVTATAVGTFWNYS